MNNSKYTNYHLSPSLHSIFKIRYSPIGVLRTIFIFFFSLCFASSLPAQEWIEPVNITNLGGYSKSPDMVIDYDGVIHVVWVYKELANYGLIMYSFSTDDGITWSEPLDLLQNNEYLMEQPHIACDCKNNLYVTYTHDNNGVSPEGRLIKMLTRNDQQWSEPIVVSEGMAGSHHNRIIIDNNNRVIIRWDYGPTGDDFFRYLENNIWSEIFCPYPSTDEIFSLVQPVVDSDNNLYFIGSSLGSSYHGQRLQYFFFDYQNNIWISPLCLTEEDTVGVGKDITISKMKLPICIYQKVSEVNFSGTDSSKFIKSTGVSWIKPELISGIDGSQEYQQIEIDQNDEAHSVEVQETCYGYGLYHFTKIKDNWVGQLVDSCYIVNFPKLAFKTDKLYLVYSKTWITEKEFSSDLFFTKYDIITNIDKKVNQPETLKIFPNPASSHVYIEFDITKQQHINLSVFDITGKLITTLANKTFQQGQQRILWNGTDQNGKEVKSGLYLVRLRAGRKTVTQTVEIIQ